MNLVFRILGRTGLLIDGTLHEDWGRRRERALLAILLVHAGRLVPINALLDWAWTDDDPLDNPLSTIQTYATRIRKWLQRLPAPVTLYAGNAGCRLEVDKNLIDYHQFRELIAQARVHARGGRHQQASKVAEQAIGLWRGRPLDELHSEPVQAWRDQVVHDQWLPANQILLDALIALGHFDEALVRLDDLQTDHGDDVTLAKQRLTVLHGLSRPSEATSYFFAIRRRMQENADEQAVQHLQRHHESLIGPAVELDASQFSVPVPPRQLRHDIPDFVGRDDLLQALDTAAMGASGDPASGVIILEGMPGVGKTALAIHWGHLIRQHFPDGDLYVDLNGFSERARITMSAVVDDLLTALGYPPSNEVNQRSRELQLSRLLTNRRTLVILDNAANSAHVKDLIPLLSECLVVVTSRQQLTLLSTATGARRVQVEPMSQAEGIQLLSTRLRARRLVAYKDRARLARMCGGLPLVISVLAEHVATRLDPQLTDFARRLDRRQLIVEVGDDGDGTANPQTFFSWSYHALPEAEQRLFRLLGLHPGPDISLEVACAIDGRNSTQTKRGLGVLVSAYLLEHTDTLDRYRFHDLLREHAAYRAGLDEPPDTLRAAERRMLDFYLATANDAKRTLYPCHLIAPELPVDETVQTVTFADAVRARTWFDRERTNLIGAIHFAATERHHDHAWRLADAAVTFFNRRGYYEDSRAVLEIAVSSAAIVGHPEAEAVAQAGLGMALMLLGDHEAARRCLAASLRFAEETRNERGKSITLQQLARLELSCGDTSAAIELFRRSLDIAVRSADDGVLCWTHCRLGGALRNAQQHDLALVHLLQAQFHAQRVGDQSAHASSLAEMGAVYRDRGEYRSAVALCERALGVVDAMPVPDLAITTQITTTLAEINLTEDRPEAAIRHALHAVVLARRSHSAQAEATALEMLGNAQFANGDREDAQNAWRDAAALYEYTGNPTRHTVVQTKIDDTGTVVDLPRGRSEDSPTAEPSDPQQTAPGSAADKLQPEPTDQ